MSPVLNELPKSVIKCINAIKANAICERFLKQFCENADYDIFEKLNMLNKQLQGSNTTLVDAKTKTFGFVTFIEYQEELSEMQNNESVKTLFNIKGVMSWLCDETETKYPNSANFARKLLLPFPSSYLVECDLSATAAIFGQCRVRF
ncbi:uncharacterized protein LOC106882538 [Octopus bimaculoides]|uniref:uncharacterized protein LOC106882538 n=1 Tax=Octopus bimaculoides TaxID=37653 RepID=UPI00071D0D33|nr:uncharacterized protein LOC106882538 [Octopus bimaculoides]|eukprot:XP_014788743.1 PREDICTED: uncharacterized protein LOC106882538 [Octopus bimaculoides]